MSGAPILSPDVLTLTNPAAAAEAITSGLEHEVRAFRRRGAVVALSGGIDSTVVAALAVRALGPDRVLGLLMPEADSAPETLPMSLLAADHFGIETVHEDITATLEAVGCYRRRDEAVRQVVPEYGSGWSLKLVLPSVVASVGYRLTSVVVRSPDGRTVGARLPPAEYRQVVAATNFKQRTRKMMEYYHADRLGYAVLGTPNRLEHDLGFFVKNGDGAADIKPIAHLFKSQVYQLADALGVPEPIRSRPPTTDTFSLPQSQEEFYFSLPYHHMDLCLFAVDHGIEPTAVAAAVGLTAEEVDRVFHDIDAKRRVSRYLHAAPRLLAPAAGPPT